MATEAPPAPPVNPAPSVSPTPLEKKQVEDPNPQAPKYSRAQSAAAEQKVVDNAASAAKKRGEVIDKTVENLLKEFEGFDDSSRTSALEEITRRVSTIKTVAANAKLRPARSHVMAEEDASMPRLAPGIDPGGDVRRNIMTQGDQNKTDALKEKK